MTQLDELTARVEALLAELRTVQAAPRAAVDPEGYPDHVAAGELLESAWGNATVDSLHRVRVANVISGDPELGDLRIVAANTVITTDLNGYFNVIFSTGFGTFSAPPAFLVAPAQGNSTQMTVELVEGGQITTAQALCRARTLAGGSVANLTIAISYIAIGRRI